MSQEQTTQNQVNQLKVSKKTYNIVRSIVESSVKDTYDFNRPVKINNVVKFVKYKGDARFWQIVIVPMTIMKDGMEFPATKIVVKDGLGQRVAELIVSEYKLLNNAYYVLRIGDNEIFAESISKFEHYVIVPDDHVPYARPVPLGNFINKLMFYKHLVSR
jgi:hypothetical protein